MRARSPAFPTIEPAGGRRRIEDDPLLGERCAYPCSVMAGIQEDVAQRIAHFFRRRLQPQMIPLGEDASGASRYPIDSPRKARGDRLHSAPKRIVVRRFDYEMGMIAL